MITTPKNKNEEYGFPIGHLFSEVVSPEQMEANLKRFQIVKDVTKAESIDLFQSC